MIIPPRFRYASPFSEGLALVKIEDHKGYINQQGEVVIASQFREAGTFHSGLCLVTTDDMIGYINPQGEFIWSGPYVETRLGFDTRL